MISRKSYDYITYDRTDLYKGGKHVITENWGKYFLVAIQKDKSGNEKVLGTVSYKQRKNGEVQVRIEILIFHPLQVDHLVAQVIRILFLQKFQNESMPPCLEIFSLSVSHKARGLGIGALLCNHIEKLAKEQKVDLFLGKYNLILID